MEPKPPINTMHQSLAEKEAEACKNTLVDSLPEVKAQKVGETMTVVKGASLFYSWSRHFNSLDGKTVNKTRGDGQAKER